MRNTQILINNGVNLSSALELLGDISFYDETLTQFIEENKTRLPNIVKYKNDNNMADYAILVHSLKSDAKYLGFTDLAEIAYTHEMASKANDINVVNEKFNDLVNTYNKYAKVAFAYLDNKPQNDNNINNNVNKISTNKKIIVADDSSIISNVVVKAFDGIYDVLVASNGQEAINLIKNNNIFIKY